MKTINGVVVYEEGDWVSTATLREYDLFRAFIDALTVAGVEVDEDAWNYYDQDEDEWNILPDKDLATISAILSERLFPALDRIAPEGCYFGAHEGDGALFGFWAYETEYEEEPGIFRP